ncbi:MAG: methylmalonyl Co-A mutase-associated GTPase MeaB [Pseudomonadota bacterium]
MTSATLSPLDDLAQRLSQGERRALSRAITLVESTRADHRADAAALLGALGPGDGKAVRIGLSGTPGVGKSTFIEALGMRLIEAGHRVAVLAVDPSSTRSGGAILGDKTRMERLARAPGAFIRPSPSQTHLGGVARRTRECIALTEAAGFDVVLVETVGVGQSETLVAEMTDVFVLLLAPGGGDELQGVKRGIMEIADLIVVNKADGTLKPVAEATRADYAAALHLMRRRAGDPEGYPLALAASAMSGEGLETVWERIQALDGARRESGHRARRRSEQAVAAMRAGLRERVFAALDADPALAEARAALEAEVGAGRCLPETAAASLFAQFMRQSTVATERPRVQRS